MQTFDDFLDEYLAEDEELRAEYEKQKEQLEEELKKNNI